MNFILFDIEATCWDGYHSNAIQEIIELGAISINRFGEKTDTYVQMAQPVINPHLSQYCQNLTGIQQKDVDAAPVFEEIYPEVEDWTYYDRDTWFVSWGEFDLKILNEECQRNFDHDSMIQNHLDFQSVFVMI